MGEARIRKRQRLSVQLALLVAKASCFDFRSASHRGWPEWAAGKTIGRNDSRSLANPGHGKGPRRDLSARRRPETEHTGGHLQNFTDSRGHGVANRRAESEARRHSRSALSVHLPRRKLVYEPDSSALAPMFRISNAQNNIDTESEKQIMRARSWQGKRTTTRRARNRARVGRARLSRRGARCEEARALGFPSTAQMRASRALASREWHERV